MRSSCTEQTIDSCELELCGRQCRLVYVNGSDVWPNMADTLNCGCAFVGLFSNEEREGTRCSVWQKVLVQSTLTVFLQGECWHYARVAA